MPRCLPRHVALGAFALLVTAPALLAGPPASGRHGTSDDTPGDRHDALPDGIAAPVMLASPQQGTRVSGGVAQLGASDDQRLVIAGVTEKNFSRTTTLVAARSPVTDIASLHMAVEAGVAEGGDLNVVASLLDFGTNEWVRVGTWRTSDDRVRTTDGVEDPDRFVHDFSGLIWLRLETQCPRPLAPEGSAVQYDQVRIVVGAVE